MWYKTERQEEKKREKYEGKLVEIYAQYTFDELHMPYKLLPFKSCELWGCVYFCDKITYRLRQKSETAGVVLGGTCIAINEW